ncbi:hypothetical protein M2650_09325 [Luteimonas sp. SX5]|uniref:Protein sip-5 n=1 Tax=Luteimonas galliterrae TaxID=2940486 RepID=A0ABT0MIZ2_9GAMM|nr:hypothetical protein [Luteimonas galliterrae]MCL1634830.1 hypothetical protein [Luteimonas galliterrae]
MRFEQLKHRVARREQLLEGRLQQTRDQWQTLRTTWRDSWTPLRIVVAGLISGFVVGRSDPVQTLGKLGALGGSGTRVLQLVTALSGLFASFQASSAADEAEHAADKADVAADAAVQAPHAGDIPAATPEPVVVAPRPAEAATELSER